MNGTRGIIDAFNDGYPVVKTYDQRYVTALPEEWKYEEKGVVRAFIQQIPLRLAWAITIHKSQGMTLDAVEMDLGDTFEPGMGYVALSRVRSLNGLKLMNLNEMALKVHPKVLQHDTTFKEQSFANCQYLENLSEFEMGNLQQNLLVNRFAGLVNGKTASVTVKTRKRNP